MRFDDHFLKGVIPSSVVLYKNTPEEAKFSIDTRTMQPGDIFIALKGARVDGHDFLAQAVAGDAAGLIINESMRSLLDQFDNAILKRMYVILVPDTLQALFRIASAWLFQFDCPVIGITGSVGKTSTKELIASILRTHGMSFIASYDNQNTKIGLSLNMLRMRQYHKAAIFELGTSMRGEIEKLADLLRPTIALITNVGHSHMEGLGSLQDIAQEKRSIFKYFTEENIGIVNGDLPLLADVGYVHPVIKFGTKTINQIQARKINIVSENIEFNLKIYREKFSIKVSYPHIGFVFNMLSAAAVTNLLGVPVDVIAQALRNSIVIPGRFEQRVIKGTNSIIIDDAYNANPESMKAALLAFQQMRTNCEKIVILGDMLELGVNSPFWHRQIGRLLRKIPSIKRVILVGDMVKWTKRTLPVGIPIDHVENWHVATDCLKRCLSDDLMVFVKGSRGMQLNKLVKELT